MRAPWGILYQDKYKLPDELIEKTKHFSEFANGGSQATVKLKDGTVINEVLLSNCTYIIAIKGYDAMPFETSEIDDVIQTQADINNRDRRKWTCWNK